MSNIMTKFTGIIVSAAVCFTLASCGSSPAEEEMSVSLETAAEIISETETSGSITETSAETTACSEEAAAEITETSAAKTETQAEKTETSAEKAETHTEISAETPVTEAETDPEPFFGKDVISCIDKMRAERKSFSGDIPDITVYTIEPKNGRVYSFTEVLHAGSENSTVKTGFVSDNQLRELTGEFNRAAELSGGNGGTDKDFSIELTDIDGYSALIGTEGKSSAAFEGIFDALADFSSGTVYYGDTHEELQLGIDKALQLTVHFRANLKRYSDLGRDCSAYAGKALVINGASEVNFFTGEDNVWPLDEDWYGSAFVKFTEDGTDVEYVNWAESEEYLSKEELVTYDDLEALYLDCGHTVGTTL